jgi:hypothetical protein
VAQGHGQALRDVRECSEAAGARGRARGRRAVRAAGQRPRHAAHHARAAPGYRGLRPQLRHPQSHGAQAAFRGRVLRGALAPARRPGEEGGGRRGGGGRGGEAEQGGGGGRVQERQEDRQAPDPGLEGAGGFDEHPQRRAGAHAGCVRV